MEYDETVQKPMTNAMANEQVRAILKRGRPRVQLGYDSHVLHIGNKIYLFIDSNEIHIKEKASDIFAWVYKMDFDTTKMSLLAYDNAKKKYESTKKHHAVIQEKFSPVFAAMCAVGTWAVLFLVVHRIDKPRREAEKREEATQAQVEAYAKTLPNYDDSIRLARTDAELQNAINHREQARLRIAHFADSLNAMNH